MSLGTLLERLYVAITADTTGFDNGMKDAMATVKKAAHGMGRDISQIGSRISGLGTQLSAAVTLPVAAAGLTLLQAAGNFEAAMIEVEQSTQATADQTQNLSDLARQLGQDWDFGATQMAEAMNDLAKNGHSAQEILGGTAASVAILARAARSELEPATNVATDAMNNFNIRAEDMDKMANQVVGTLLASKFELRDYQLAMGMAGGAAHSLGVSFEDFNAVLSATASSFTSGSDAGTSFKVFLTRLIPQSKKASETMQRLGLDFFDASGNMKDLATIADLLKSQLAGLSDEARNEALKDIFGIDALRVGAALAEKGGDAIRRLRGEIEATNAAEMAMAKTQGLNAKLRDLKAAWQELGIALGESGFLDAVTGLVRGLTGLVTMLGNLPGPVLAVGAAFAAFVALIGPVIFIIGQFVVALGTLSTAFQVGGLFAAGGALAGAGAAMSAFGAAIATAFWPITAAVATLTGLWLLYKDRLIPVFDEFGKKFSEVMGPVFEAVMSAAGEALSAFGDLWNSFMGSVFGQSIMLIVDLLGDLLVGFTTTFGGVVIDLLKGLGAVFVDVFKVIGNLVQMVAALLRGDWSAAWDYAGQAVYNAAHAIGMVVVTLVQTVVNAVTGIYNGVKDWLVDKLSALWGKVKDKIDTVKKAFYDLYDAVVGNSYIPDMVDGIASEMGRLDGVMVDPALAAVAQVIDGFAALPDAISGPMEAANDNIKQATSNISDAFNDQLKNMIDGKGFNIGDMLRQVVKKQGDEALDEISEYLSGKVGNLVKSLMRQMSGGGGLFNIGGPAAGGGGSGALFSSLFKGIGSIFGGFRAGGGPVMPNKAFMVGERGPEMFVPNSSGSIVPNNRLGGGQGNVINFNFPQGTDPERFRRTESQMAAMAGRVVGAGARNR
jgi:TP901 family phage tail tape measure protein